MRDRILGFLLIYLLSITIFLILSFNSGFGYVYIQWLGWQLQTNLLLLWLLLLTIGVLVYIVWRLLKRSFRRRMQQHLVPSSFEQLHLYEQLGIVWLLRAEQVEQNRVISAYQNSELLYPLMNAKLMIHQEKPEQAKEWLKQTKNPLFELTELLKIDVALLEKNYEQVFDRLEFLTVQPLSAWLSPMQKAYQIELQNKWSQLSLKCPWWIFRASQQPKFNSEQKQIWLFALLEQSQNVLEEDKQLLHTWFYQIKSELTQFSLDEKIALLKLINQFDRFNDESVALAATILQQRFTPEVLYIWLAKVLRLDISIESLEQQVRQWQLQYPAQSSLTFAQWHILQRQQQYEKAQQLLSQFPDDVYMAYLRVQGALKDFETLQYDLKLLLQYSRQDFKFDL